MVAATPRQRTQAEAADCADLAKAEMLIEYATAIVEYCETLGPRGRQLVQLLDCAMRTVRAVRMATCPPHCPRCGPVALVARPGRPGQFTNVPGRDFSRCAGKSPAEPGHVTEGAGPRQDGNGRHGLPVHGGSEHVGAIAQNGRTDRHYRSGN